MKFFELIFDVKSGWSVQAVLNDDTKQMLCFGQPTMEDAMRQAAQNCGIGSLVIPLKHP